MSFEERLVGSLIDEVCFCVDSCLKTDWLSVSCC